MIFDEEVEKFKTKWYIIVKKQKKYGENGEKWETNFMGNLVNRKFPICPHYHPLGAMALLALEIWKIRGKSAKNAIALPHKNMKASSSQLSIVSIIVYKLLSGKK